MIKIYGASDDLVLIEGGNGDDEIGCYNHDVLIVLGNKGSGGVAVVCSYEPRARIETRRTNMVDKGVIGAGCWSLEFVQLDESIPIPWAITLTHEARNKSGTDIGYTVVAHIDAPPDVPMHMRRFERPL